MLGVDPFGIHPNIYYRTFFVRHFLRSNFLIYSRNRLDTKHFKAISVCVASNGVQRWVFEPKGVRRYHLALFPIFR